MTTLLIVGGALAAAAGSLWLLAAEVGGRAPAPHLAGQMVLCGLGAVVAGWVWGWTARRLGKMFRRRCIQCGREAVKGSIYCGPHLREAATLQRERSELDRL
jgi:hypothetical protein